MIRWFRTTAFRIAAFMAMVAGGVSFPTYLYSQAPNGSIAGHVTDSAGHPLSGAVTHVVNMTLGAQTSDGGTYHIANVPAGSYMLRVSAPGFATDSVAVTVTAGVAATQDIRLK